MPVCCICDRNYEGWWSDEWYLVPETLRDRCLCVGCFENEIGQKCEVLHDVTCDTGYYTNYVYVVRSNSWERIG